LPVLELLGNYFRIQDTEATPSRRDKVCAALDALGPALTETLPYLFALLGIQGSLDPLAEMDPQIKRQRTLDAIKRIILHESLNQPTVVVFEDLHWIDVETQALLDLLADSIATTRVLLLVNYRPEYHHEWTNRSYYSQLHLDALATEAAGGMLGALLGDAVELAPLKRLISERTEGNPFFIEETVQALFDQGALVSDGTVKVTRALSQMRIPSTVQGILASRIDRLPSDRKQLLQTLAVIGRETPLGLIKRMAGNVDAPLKRMLADLRAAEFIYERPPPADTGFIFKHALTQEVAYNSLLIGRRKLLHERAGQALETMFADRLDDHLSELAHHYSNSENVDKAVEYLGRAGQQAAQRSAYAGAISNLGAALSLLQNLPENPERIRRELLLQLAVGPALIAVKGWAAPEVERAYSRVRELGERAGNAPEFSSGLIGLWVVYLLRAQLGTAFSLAEELLRRARREEDSALLQYAYFALGNTSFWRGELLSAREHLEKAIELYSPERHRPLIVRFGGVDAGVFCLSYSSWTLLHLGCLDRALSRSKESIELAQGLSHPHSMAFAGTFAGFVLQGRREVAATGATTEAVIALSSEHGLTDWLAWATSLYGWAIANSGRDKEGIAKMCEGLAASQATGAVLLRPYFLTLLAAACIEAGASDRALSALSEALEAANEHEIHHYEPETHRLIGELQWRRSDSNTVEAQHCFERAIQIARKQSAKLFELRATMSLARLLSDTGRRDEAHTILAQIYNLFSEGFDTADLKDARALLDELSD
jgi:predicted ATPase